MKDRLSLLAAGGFLGCVITMFFIEASEPDYQPGSYAVSEPCHYLPGDWPETYDCLQKGPAARGTEQ